MILLKLILEGIAVMFIGFFLVLAVMAALWFCLFMPAQAGDLVVSYTESHVLGVSTWICLQAVVLGLVSKMDNF